MNKIRISAVSYLNTIPFLYGLNNTEGINEIADISLDVPSKCARKIIENEADIGLIPVGSLLSLKEYKIISPFCLSTDKEVFTVKLYSQVPLNEIKSILLDYQSMTSINLARILAKHYWKINPEFINAEQGYIGQIKDKTAGVIIGDRVFDVDKDFKYSYDLSLEWYNFTKLPFTFAVWVANKTIDNKYIEKINQAFKFGVDNISLAITAFKDRYACLSENEIHNYLFKNISFHFSELKQKSLNQFLELQANL